MTGPAAERTFTQLGRSKTVTPGMDGGIHPVDTHLWTLSGPHGAVTLYALQYTAPAPALRAAAQESALMIAARDGLWLGADLVTHRPTDPPTDLVAALAGGAAGPGGQWIEPCRALPRVGGGGDGLDDDELDGDDEEGRLPWCTPSSTILDGITLVRQWVETRTGTGTAAEGSLWELLVGVYRARLVGPVTEELAPVPGPPVTEELPPLTLD